MFRVDGDGKTQAYLADGDARLDIIKSPCCEGHRSVSVTTVKVLESYWRPAMYEVCVQVEKGLSSLQAQRSCRSFEPSMDSWVTIGPFEILSMGIDPSPDTGARNRCLLAGIDIPRDGLKPCHLVTAAQGL